MAAYKILKDEIYYEVDGKPFVAKVGKVIDNLPKKDIKWLTDDGLIEEVTEDGDSRK